MALCADGERLFELRAQKTFGLLPNELTFGQIFNHPIENKIMKPVGLLIFF